jgi:imidazole glycerol phosphate synthase glutamine amidotransferase subunit
VNITLLDYGAGNVASVERALQRFGVTPVRATTPQGISNAQAIILPGVGHYAAIIRALDEYGLRTALLEAIERGVPFLGICLGLQALYESSDEAPELAGLGVHAGRVRALPATCKLPHMGWNQLQRQNAESRLLAGIPDNAYFYFAHSYAALPQQNGPSTGVSATCTHGAEFIAVLEKENTLAVQFHPEKSGRPGARLLENFVRLAQ